MVHGALWCMVLYGAWCIVHGAPCCMHHGAPWRSLALWSSSRTLESSSTTLEMSHSSSSDCTLAGVLPAWCWCWTGPPTLPLSPFFTPPQFQLLHSSTTSPPTASPACSGCTSPSSSAGPPPSSGCPASRRPSRRYSTAPPGTWGPGRSERK